MSEHMTTCEVCERSGPTRAHPCRFALGCSCWRGEPCHTIGKGIRLDPTDDRRKPPMCSPADAPPYVRPCLWPGGCPVADIPDHGIHTDSAEECNARMREVQGGSCGAPHEHHAYQPDPIAPESASLDREEAYFRRNQDMPADGWPTAKED